MTENKNNNNQKKSTKEEFEKTQLSIDENQILEKWNKNNTFKKTLEQTKDGEEFVFYDGPPFATGAPHYGHLIPGTIKDVIPRYKTMKGFHVERNWGWDCHGMPIENIVEKKHNLNSKADIENFGIGSFCASAKESIFSYKDTWEETIPRTGRWVDMENHYKTMDSDYTESVWWGFSEFNKKGLVKKDFKSMHICPRCETTLSNRDVSEGYKDIKDLSVTAKFELEDEKNTFVLAWTTTPWTLPGNVALAIGEDIEYIKTSNDQNNEKYIFAKNLFEKIQKQAGFDLKIIEEINAKDLIGKKYIPLFDYYSKDENLENRENGWKIYSGDFVNINDGTGIVHIAPAFGEDDMELGRKYNLPWVQHIGIDGKFKKEVTDFGDIPVRKTEFHEEVDIEIIKFLAHNNKLFFKEKYSHSYPHCWRCKTPLLNYATSSWFIDVPKIKDELVEENKKVNWVPEYIGKKRFANWLKNARPWAISRSRYWGTPIPIWENAETGDYKIIGSLAELKEKTSNKNNYVLFRHGESLANKEDILCFIKDSYGDKLTINGEQQVISNASKIIDDLKNSKYNNGEKIDIIFSSPFGRTKETAEIIKKELNYTGEIIYDERLVESNFGKENNGQPNDVWRNIRNQKDFNIETKIGTGESIQEVKNRMMDFFYDIESKYKNKNILIISHHLPLVTVLNTVENKKDYLIHLDNATSINLDFAPVPHNEKYELDYHRPFIDEISFTEDGKEYKFIKDVFDTWFDSGSMSFASKHYPFENTDTFNPSKNIGYPADFISEAMEQTRGWFYVSMVIGKVLFDKAPYKNVVAHGMLMAEDGKKMSKSLNNYPPMDKILNKYGADSLRLFLLTSSIVKGDSPSFSEKGVDEISKKIVIKTKNILSFYNMYKDKVTEDLNIHKSNNVLDIWIIEKTKKLIQEVEEGLENYALDDAARPFFDYVDDFSTWYIRRSRDRYKGQDTEDRDYAILTTKWVLKNFAKVLAPFAPFLAEIIWENVKDDKDKESVHMEEWPENKKNIVEKISNIIKKDDILEQMSEVREIVSKGLESRVSIGQKVRQPLGNALVLSKNSTILKNDQFIENIKDELNIKNIFIIKSEKDFTDELKNKFQNIEDELKNYFLDEENTIKVILDTKITPELAEEGDFREFLRQIQVLRKKDGLKVNDNIDLKVNLLENDKDFIENNLEELKNTAGVLSVNYSDITDGKELDINGKKIIVLLVK